MVLVIILMIVGFAFGLAMALASQKATQEVTGALGFLAAVVGMIHFCFIYPGVQSAALGLIINFGAWMVGVFIGALVHGPTDASSVSRQTDISR